MDDLIEGAGTPSAGFAPEQTGTSDDAPTTHDVQAASEGVVIDADHIEFFGEKFRLADSIGMMPLLRFANASKNGLDSEDMEGMAAMYAMIRDVIHRPALFEADGTTRILDPLTGKPAYDEHEWNRFVETATDSKAEGEDIMGFINQAMPVIAARPRKRPGDSSPSQPQISPTSKDGSSSPATDARMQGLTNVADV